MKISRRQTLLAATAASAMAALAYNVTGTVTDRQGEPLMDATVRILAEKDSSFVKGSIADINGNFKVSDLKNGRYMVETTYIGYNKTFTPFRISGKSVSVDTIRIDESSIVLQEATVIGVKTPIKVMEDTIEYNADTYKTPPNAVVEDLLKRLPGVEVDSEGKITANGKEVAKILIDGKEFFSDDPKVASKNLPVNLVDKLQVVDRKSDLARLTGVDDGEDETVINLTVKKHMKNGWFGTVEGGYGTDDRYLGRFYINRFWGNNQLTFLGSANNINELGFTDGNGNRFRRFGGSNGINNSQNFGVNFNLGSSEKLRFGGDVMYSHTNIDTRKRQERQYLFANDPTFERSTSDALDLGHNLRSAFRGEWKPDSFNTIDFR
ncbi:MAG: TonB-dependent receptor, partial [Muribaculaceae bacterium]|nr:TonB-dependent receptor [Muribaculaceae bacterium]